MAKIETPKISEILREEFMIPFNLSSYMLAKKINIPTSRIQDILHNRRKITADTSIRLAKLFGVSDTFFLNIQNEIDIRHLKHELSDVLTTINPISFNNSILKNKDI